MTEPTDHAPFRGLIDAQLGLLDFYESLLDTYGWDEGRANATLKTLISATLALLRVQRSLGGDIVTLQRDLIRQHRERLEQWLAEHGGRPAGGGPG
jgi:hypothetical protein